MPASLKLLLYVSLIACLFVPWGLGAAGAGRAGAASSASPPMSAKLAVGGFLLALFETAIAKMRVFRVPEFLGAALMLGLLGDAAAASCPGASDEPDSISTSPICSPARWC